LNIQITLSNGHHEGPHLLHNCCNSKQHWGKKKPSICERLSHDHVRDVKDRARLNTPEGQRHDQRDLRHVEEEEEEEEKEVVVEEEEIMYAEHPNYLIKWSPRGSTLTTQLL
jgi:hypothetical protein